MDIVGRLRQDADGWAAAYLRWKKQLTAAKHTVNLEREAADEIERLRAAFRINMLRMDPTLPHAEIDRVIAGEK